jgi:hypothetical protein
MLASRRATSDSAASEQIATDMPECHHSPSPSVPKQQNKQDSNSISCCLPDAVSQKSTPVILQICTTEAAVASIGIQVPAVARSAAPNPLHAWSPRGRDILLETASSVFRVHRKTETLWDTSADASRLRSTQQIQRRKSMQRIRAILLNGNRARFGRSSKRGEKVVLCIC